MTLHNVTIDIKSVLNKYKNHYHYKIFLEKRSYELAKKLSQIFVRSIIIKNLLVKIWDVNVDNIVISKLVKTKTNSTYLIGYSDQTIIPLVLIMPEMSGYVKTFKVSEGNSKLMSFRVDDEKQLEKYKAIWTKIEELIKDLI